MSKFLGLLAQNELEIADDNGNTQRVPLVGAFKNKRGYYVVVLAEEHGKSEFVMYKVLKRQDDTEYIQIITDVVEWEEAYQTWIDINKDISQ